MITIQSAESALKNIYLDSVINDINTKTNPFLTMVQKNVRTVNGKEARTVIRYGNEDSVRAGEEGGDLPVSQNLKFAEIISPLKNLYGTFQISDKAIRAAQNNAGAFAAMLSGEMQNLVSTAQANLNSMLYGNGMFYLGYTTAVSGATVTVPKRYLSNFKTGMAVDIYNAGNDKINTATVTVSAINASTGVITLSASVPTNKFDRLYLYSATQKDVELYGIDSIFMTDKIYNLAVSEHTEIAPCVVKDTATTLGVLDEDAIISFFDKYEEHCQGMPCDIILTHPNVRKAVFEDLRDLRTNVDTMELAGGFRAFTFNGIPVYSDLKCKGGTLYALNSDSWNMHELCDWTWLSGEDGSVLRQIDGKAGYCATLVKYADLICDKPFIQGKVTNYSTASSL